MSIAYYVLFNALAWKRCDGETWCPLEELDLEAVEDEGVYVIWFGRHPKKNCVYIGQGDVADRLGKHLTNIKIRQYRACGTHYVTWAEAPQEQRGGIERFLAFLLEPRVGAQHPKDLMIPVFLPWWVVGSPPYDSTYYVPFPFQQ